VLFKIKGIPVFYFPYLSSPWKPKTEPVDSSFPYGDLQYSKGRQFSSRLLSFLGPSADITFLWRSYFSLRGMDTGGIFRAPPTRRRHPHSKGYGVDDRQGREAPTWCRRGKPFQKRFPHRRGRYVTTNFMFRQLLRGFARRPPPRNDPFFSQPITMGTFPQLCFQREEVFLPADPLSSAFPFDGVQDTRKQLGRLPLIFYFSGGSRRTVRRVGYYDRRRAGFVSGSISILAWHCACRHLPGFSIVPSAGIRETYYSARLTRDAIPEGDPHPPATPIHGNCKWKCGHPELENGLPIRRSSGFQHHIEPMVTYRGSTALRKWREMIRLRRPGCHRRQPTSWSSIVNRIGPQASENPRASARTMSLLDKNRTEILLRSGFPAAFLPGPINSSIPYTP